MIEALFQDKFAIAYLVFGLIGGFVGTIIRIARRYRDSDLSNDKVTFVDVLELFAYTVLGGCIALGADKHILLSLTLGISAPVGYDFLDKIGPRYFARFLDKRETKSND